MRPRLVLPWDTARGPAARGRLLGGQGTSCYQLPPRQHLISASARHRNVREMRQQPRGLSCWQLQRPRAASQDAPDQERCPSAPTAFGTACSAVRRGRRIYLCIPGGHQAVTPGPPPAPGEGRALVGPTMLTAPQPQDVAEGKRAASLSTRLPKPPQPPTSPDIHPWTCNQERTEGPWSPCKRPWGPPLGGAPCPSSDPLGNRTGPAW